MSQTIENIRYEPLQSIKKAPFHFKWFKYEIHVIIAIVALILSYLFYDFRKLMVEILSKEKKIAGLVEGYFGYPRDHNDGQWRHWRDSLGIMIAAAIAHLVLGALVKKQAANSPKKTSVLLYQIVFGACLVWYTQRAGMLYWILFTSFFFVVIVLTHRWRMFPLLLWGLAILTLYLNERYQGYGFNKFSIFSNHPLMKYLHESLMEAPIRWNIIFNMIILKMISFGMDLHWAYRQNPVSQRSKDSLSYRQRQETHQPIRNYNLLTYYAFLLYFPLFLTGPITTFNAWISQIYIPQKEYSTKGIVKYGLRFLLCFICFEIFLHLYYVQAISTRQENVHIWNNYFNTHQLLFLGLLEMFFLWFKFLVIWRFHRLWALIDGIESPENMNRCVANNYSFEGFWRSWHRSFNQWLIRYIFIPLGGSKYKLYNVWAVFSFVAIWHDMNLNLLMWSWIICLTLMPEMLIKWYFHKERNRYLWNQIWFKYATAFVAGLVVVAMIIANLIGYGTGYKGLWQMLKQVEENQDYSTVFFTIILLTTGTALNFRIREWEDMKGEAKSY